MSWVSALIVIDQEERSHYQHSLTMEQWMTPTQGWWLSWSCWWRSSSASLAWSSPAVRSVPRVLPPLSSDQCQSMVTPLHQCCGKLQTVAGVQHFLIRPTLTSTTNKSIKIIQPFMLSKVVMLGDAGSVMSMCWVWPCEQWIPRIPTSHHHWTQCSPWVFISDPEPRTFAALTLKTEAWQEGVSVFTMIIH